MSDNTNSTPVRILEKFYRFGCHPSEHHELQQSAQYLDEKMRLIRDGGKVAGNERIAIMAALNLAHELMLLKNQKDNYIDTMGNRISVLHQKIEDALSQSEQTEL